MTTRIEIGLKDVTPCAVFTRRGQQYMRIESQSANAVNLGTGRAELFDASERVIVDYGVKVAVVASAEAE